MNTKIILTIFIAFIMITSVIGFIWSGYSSNDIDYEIFEYGNYNFKKISGKYVLDLEGKEYIFDNTPYELNDVSFENFNIESDKYYILFDSKEKDVNMEYSIQKLYLVLNSLGIKVQLACSTEEGCDSILPIKNCEDYAFYFRKADNAKLYKDNNCVVIEGDNYDISREVDKIDLLLLKII